MSKYLNDIDVKSSVGVVCKSKSYGDFKIVEYKGCNNVVVEFLETGYQKLCQNKEIKTGAVKDKLLPSVLGVGIVGDKYNCKINGKYVKEYQLWKSMLSRCYNDAYKNKYPTYEGCEVSDNFKYYEYFYEWCHNQIGFGIEGFELDKDLPIKGNKVYSESTCVFIPKEINLALTKSDKIRGEYLIGVCWHKRGKAFVAQVSKNTGKREHLGSFNTEIEAFNAYKIAKEIYVKELADKWKDKIDPRAYNALMNYEVSIND